MSSISRGKIIQYLSFAKRADALQWAGIEGLDSHVSFGSTATSS
jgi:hypothetical protein